MDENGDSEGSRGLPRRKPNIPDKGQVDAYFITGRVASTMNDTQSDDQQNDIPALLEPVHVLGLQGPSEDLWALVYEAGRCLRGLKKARDDGQPEKVWEFARRYRTALARAYEELEKSVEDASREEPPL